MCIFAAPAVAAGTTAAGGAATAAGVGAAATTAATTAGATATGLFGLGAKASNLFLASLGLTAGTGLMQKAATEKTANQIYQSALIANQSAENAFRNQMDGLSERLKETKKSRAQEKFAANIKSLQAKSKIIASERAGLAVDVLLADQNRQAANFREAIKQTTESDTRQYGRDIKGYLAQKSNRRNQLTSNINQAYNQVPTLGSILLNTAAQGLMTYAGLTSEIA
tara:strand:+ start:581 stop:1255 length:675 start_codon:yes stop_codon:yes gene_type:complete